MKIAFFDCFSGISGDMAVGALIDLGLDFEYLKKELRKLQITDYRLQITKVRRSGIRGIKFNVDVNLHKQHHRDLEEINGIINKSKLNDEVKSLSKAIFYKIAKAEAKVHGVKVKNVHFHEIGAVDSIIDIVAFSIGLNYLKIDKVISSPINVGEGFVKTEHGLLPMPAPATAEILKGIPFYSNGTKMELATPTGAAIIATVAEGFMNLPAIMAEKIGYGAGSREINGTPNLLRIFLAQENRRNSSGYDNDMITVIETNIDDLPSQVYEELMENVLEAGALDIFLTPIIMKKNRPAVKVSILTEKEKALRVCDILFKETSTFGIRTYEAFRYKLEREGKKIKTSLGNVEIKSGKIGGKIFKVAPEYENIKKISRDKGIPLLKVLKKVEAEINKRFKL
ncbi:MAG: TIGR00299 family protein [Candidatus Schekmanbacteria bacterium RIFCSPHIGHO2_02_FULL_38_11]|uniref:Putative nickel insertion protein n=1 Tax=Candidatus Schekmanbacteria bacterium RIFCSPLOWO2_12_FULL_38_15 TaxID=1817883 RepID=A0A1F7SDU2_9BACT|nr:MAG: TIGR00299 family protein [Candidatus Schekmanbacteria bacterium GWA2_38_9]OGL49901.1 MAG: TIGR00299 family protein [Candidatus Schekmanbacteria bacterium RIFCSPLOWO2_02_FULL_38_14]OGL51679.1 MAG: TIGR00299 family protein [Candidatus Schekmanbacteria bacterium RIFCSPHIGHO2_02_FULL_38_11]OGL51940.1 MAG: TIGR00299 family protein [Candidatus Schekmanbacteria bacterium RIFCSPLOWO2_12_FULL_38_15]